MEEVLEQIAEAIKVGMNADSESFVEGVEMQGSDAILVTVAGEEYLLSIRKEE